MVLTRARLKMVSALRHWPSNFSVSLWKKWKRSPFKRIKKFFEKLCNKSKKKFSFIYLSIREIWVKARKNLFLVWSFVRVWIFCRNFSATRWQGKNTEWQFCCFSNCVFLVSSVCVFARNSHWHFVDLLNLSESLRIL